MTLLPDVTTLTSKYVKSPIDGKLYCRKNGKFLRHLIDNGFAGYADWFEKTYPDSIQYCACGKKCGFHNATMTFRATCGDRECVNKVSSDKKQAFTLAQRASRTHKYRDTMSKKTDEEHAAHRNKSRQVWLEKYGTDHPWKNPEIREKIAKGMQERYGADNFSTSLLSDKALVLLQNREYMLEQHVTKQMPILRLAQEIGVNERTVKLYLGRHNIEIHRGGDPWWEQELARELSAIGVEFECNTRTLIPPKEIDFYIPSHRIAIELCGLYWHSDKHDRITKRYHEHKMLECQKRGIRLLTIFEDEWQSKRAIVMSTLKHLLNATSARRYARTMTLVENVSVDECRSFLEETHIQGYAPGSVTVGLYNSGVLYALAVFAKHPGGEGWYNLSRFASRDSVVGAFGKVLNYFITKHHPQKIITFADLRWSDGALYDLHGFDLDGTIPPDYSYVVGCTRHHKFGFRHKLLAKKLDNYDPSLSERENCTRAGLYRVWDCGKKRYVWTV